MYDDEESVIQLPANGSQLYTVMRSGIKKKSLNMASVSPLEAIMQNVDAFKKCIGSPKRPDLNTR